MSKQVKKSRNWTLYLVAILLVISVVNYFQLSSMMTQVGGPTGAIVTGGADKITIVEFSDFECPFCGRAAPTVKQVLDTYGDKVELVYKHFPLSFHPNAQKAGEASECAKDQGKFQEYHDTLFQNQQALGVDNLKQYADDLGLNTNKFNDCLDSGDKTDLVKADFAEGSSKGVSGTPTFFINGEQLVGAQPFTAFKEIIDRQLGGGTPTGAAVAAPAPAPSAAGCGIQAGQPSAQAPTGPVDVSVDDDPVKGDADAKITIIEFSDFQCPFCKRFYTQTLPQIQKEYIDTGKAKLVYRDYPLSFHPEAQKSAEAAECADDQGKFWEFHDMMFDNQGSLSNANYKAWAQELSLDTAQFNDCLDSGKYASEVQKDFQEGQAAGVRGTPSFFINGVYVRGAQPWDVFKEIIDAELAK